MGILLILQVFKFNNIINKMGLQKTMNKTMRNIVHAYRIITKVKLLFMDRDDDLKAIIV